MPIRQKLKARFSSKNKLSVSSTPTDDTPNPDHYTGRTDIEYYKPHEIPKSKYRGRVDPAHQTKLNSYSFEDAFTAMRRPSAAPSGTFSPGGTRAFSRRNSHMSIGGSRTPARSRRSSLSSDANPSFSIPSYERTPAEPTPGENTESDADNGMFTADDVPVIRIDHQATVAEKLDEVSQSHIEHSPAPFNMPFTPDELSRAITKGAHPSSTLAVL